MNIVYVLAAFGIGMMFSTQPAINGEVAKIVGGPVSAATISVAFTLLFCLLVLPLFGGIPSRESLVQMPWWILVAGLTGTLVVAGGAAIVPVTGVAVFFVCLIAGQLVGSLLVDYIGAFGVDQRPVSLTKLAGIGLALGGVLLVRLG